MRLLSKIYIPALAMACLLQSCSTNSRDTGYTPRPAYRIPASILSQLTTDSVRLSAITNSIKFNGIVDYNTDKVQNVYPLVSGIASDIMVKPGDYVKAGQVLAVIRSSEIANYNAALVQAETNVALTAAQLTRTEDMARSGLAAQIDVTAARIAFEQAKAAKTAAARVLKVNGDNRNGEYMVKAPIEGYIVQKNITNGMAIRTDNNTSLFTIADLKEVWVQANVYEANINNVHEGDKACISTLTDPDKVVEGRVDRLMNTLDPTNRVMKMRVILPNTDGSLKPQMFATITVKNQLDRQALAVPASALIFDHSQYYVLIYNNPADVKITPVTLLGNNGETAYIKSGLSGGERVITSQALLIYASLNS